MMMLNRNEASSITSPIEQKVAILTAAYPRREQVPGCSTKSKMSKVRQCGFTEGDVSVYFTHKFKVLKSFVHAVVILIMYFLTCWSI